MAHSVTIAKQVDLKDPEENLGAQVLREIPEERLPVPQPAEVM